MKNIYAIICLFVSCSFWGCARDGLFDSLVKGDATNTEQTFFTVATASANEGQTLTFTVSFNNPVSQAIAISYATADMTALAGSDYVAASGTLNFAPGETTKTFTVATVDDVVTEFQELFKVAFSGNGVGYNSSASTSVVAGIITNDDLYPTGTVHVDDVSVTEGGNLVFHVFLADVQTGIVTVDYATGDGTATLADSDYTNTSGTVTFNPGEIEKTVTVPTTADTKYETDEDITLTLSGGSGYVAADSDLSGTGTITNDDSIPTISIADASADEGSAITFTVTLSNESYQTVTVDYTSGDDTATTADSDYTTASGTITFNPGDTSKTFDVNTTQDTKYEADETITSTLSGGTNYDAVGSTFSAAGTITNEDAVPALSIAAASGTEGSNVIFTVTQDRLSDFNTTFDYASSSGTATSGTDFTATNGSTSIAAGDLTTTISVPAKEDSLDETDEDFTMTISNPGNSSITTADGTGTIVDTILYYDFMSGALPANTSFSRNSTGTYYDASGNLVSAAANSARFDHDPANCVAGVCPARGLLMEPAATNLIVRSAEFDNASWTKLNTRAITANNGDSATPDGVNTNGELLREDNNFGQHYVQQAIGTAVAAGSLVQLTVYAKNYSANPGNFLRIRVSSGANNIAGYFDLSGGNSPTTSSAGNGGGQIAVSAEDVGNGWERLRLAGVPTTSSTALTVRISLLSSFAGGTSFAGDNTSGVQLWGAQLEVGNAVPTSYIPTTNATASRNADVLSSTLFTGFSGSFGDGTDWTMITDFSRPIYAPTTTSSTPRAAEFCISATCSTNRISSRYDSSAQTFGTESYIGGASQGNSLTGAIVAGNNTVYQLGVVKTAGSIQTYLNGTSYTASASISYPTVDTLYVGGSSYAGSELIGHLRKFTLRARSVPNANMLTLTND